MQHQLRDAQQDVRASRVDEVRSLEAATIARSDLIRIVLQRNPSAHAAQQAWRAALARYRRAGTYEDPMFTASFAPLSIASSQVRFGYEVEISQRIPLGGKLDAQARLAAAEAHMAASGYADTRLRLAQAASDLYDDYALALRSLEIQEEHIELMRTLEQSAVAAYDSGHAAAQDSLQAEAELAQIEYQATVYETRRDVAKAQINALLHRAPEGGLPLPSVESLRLRVDDPVQADRQAHAIDGRPDLASARARIHSASAKSAAARSDYVPDLTVFTGYSSMWNMPEHRWMAGVSLSVPLQRARLQAAMDEAAAVHAAAESEMRSAADAAHSQVAIARRQLAEAELAVKLFENKLVPIAKERIEVARAGFVTEQNNFMTVIEAERSLRTAQLELQMARSDVNKRAAELARSLGRLPGVDDAEGREEAP